MSDFTLTSEYLEKDIVIDSEVMNAYQSSKECSHLDNRESTGDITTIKVFKDSGVDEIDPNSLKQYISKNTDIKKVVIEKVSLEEASRISLLFEPDESKKNPPIARTRYLEEEQSTFDLSQLEDEVNLPFFNGALSSLSEVQEAPAPIMRARLSMKQSGVSLSDKKKESNASKDDLKSESVSHDKPTKRAQLSNKSSSVSLSVKKKESNTFKDDVESKSKPQEEPVKRARFSAKQSSTFSEGQDEESKGTLAYEKHSLTRKRSQKSAGYYYRVKDHMELYKVGSSYLRDYQSGVRSMGFSSYNLSIEGAKTIFGITSFFNYHDDLNMCIITDNLRDSFYTSILEEFQMRTDMFAEEGVEYDLFHADGNDFIEYSEIINVKCRCNHSGPEDFVEFLLEKYDLILWDLPALEYMNRSREIFFPIVRALESLTLIVGAEVSKGKELNALISYYQKYQVPVKGVLFSDSKDSRKKKEARDGLA